MFKVLKDEKIIGISEGYPKLLDNYEVVEDTQHNVDDYGQYNGEYLLKEDIPAESIEEKLQRLESEYDMNRWQREAILADGSPYSDFTKARARELEDLAEELRREKEDSSMEG